MKFPEPTANFKEIARRYHHIELEEEKKIGNSKWKQLTTEAKKDNGSMKDGETAPKGKGAKKSALSTGMGRRRSFRKHPNPRSTEQP
jgi:hypothetical protein